MRQVDLEENGFWMGALVRPKASEVSRLLADTTRAREKLEWTPAIDLDEGLQRTIDWFKGRKDQFCPETYHV